MALYREDSTGFLQEHASNPGAGYTAISAMPTDTVANRVAWWRALDTYGQTSSWHPSEYRSPEDPAEAALTIRFSREAGFISADPDGTVTDAYLAANTTVAVYRGSTDVTITEAWALTKVEDGCTSTLTLSGGVHTLQITDIPLLATKQGYVRITAERIGVQVVRDFNFIKVLQGTQGADGGTGATVVLDNDSHGVPFTDGAGNYSGSGTSVIVYLGGTQLTAHATNTANCFRITGASASGITAGSIAADKGSIGNHSAMTADTATVTLTIAIYDAAGLYATIGKKQTLTRTNNGTLVSITATPMVVKKSASGVFTPSDKVTFAAVAKNLPPGKTTADFIWYFSFTGGSSTTAGWDGSWASAGPLNLGINSDYSGAPTWSWAPDSQSPITIGIALNGDTVILDRVTLAYAKDGVDGANGTDGADGTRGSRQILVTTATGAWDNTTAWNGIVTQTGTNPVLSDLVTIAKTDGTVANSKFYSGGASPGAWTTPTSYINGSLLVTGTVAGDRLVANTVTADKIDSRSLSIKDAAGNVILQAGSPIDSGYVGSDNQNLAPGLPGWSYGPGTYRFTGETAAQSGDSIVIPSSNTNTVDSPSITLYADYVTVSFKGIYYSGTARSAYIRIYTADYVTLIASTTIPLTTSVARYIWTTSALVSTASYRILISATSGTAQVQIFDIKVERSAKATAWIPYGQDMATVYNPITNSNVGTFIADAAIPNAKIDTLSASKITTGTLNASVVSVTNLNASNITAGTLNVDRINANSIVGGKISTTDGSAIATNNLNSNAVTNNYAGVVGLTYTNTTSGSYTWNQTVNANSGSGRRFVILVTVRFYAASGTTYTMTWDIQNSSYGTVKSGAATSADVGDVRTIALMHVDAAPSDSSFAYHLRMSWTASNTSACYYQFDYVILELKR